MTGNESIGPRSEQNESGGRRVRIALRSGLFHLAYYLHTAGMLVFVTPICFILPQRICLSVTNGWARRSLWLLRKICGTVVEYRGLQNLPRSPFILAHKHQSELETFALMATMKNASFIIKRELLFVPIWGAWAIKTGMIFVTRGAGSVALRQIRHGAARASNQGRPVVIAPEGSRRLPGAPPAFKYGVVHLYTELKIPVVPMALNTGLYWPWLGFLRHPGKAVLSFLPPILPGLSPDIFENRLVELIESECDRLLMEADRSSHPPPFGQQARARLENLRQPDAATKGSGP